MLMDPWRGSLGFIFTFTFQPGFLKVFLLSLDLNPLILGVLSEQVMNMMEVLSAHKVTTYIVSFFPTRILFDLNLSNLIIVSSCSKLSFVHEKEKVGKLEENKTISQCQCKVLPWELLGRTSICFSNSVSTSYYWWGKNIKYCHCSSSAQFDLVNCKFICKKYPFRETKSSFQI